MCACIPCQPPEQISNILHDCGLSWWQRHKLRHSSKSFIAAAAYFLPNQRKNELELDLERERERLLLLLLLVDLACAFFSSALAVS